MRRWIAIIIAAVALLMVVDAVAWRVLTARMRVAWIDFVAQQRAAGWQIASSEPLAEGFPLAARLRLTDVEIAHDSKPVPGGIGAGAQVITLELPFTSPTRIVLHPQGAMHLRVGSGPDVDFTADSLIVRGALSGGEVDLAGHQLQANTVLGSLNIASASATLLPQTGDLTVALDTINLPTSSRAALVAPTLDHVGFNVTLVNTVLTIRTVSLNWGKLSVTGQGQFQPDAHGQPAGDAKLNVFGAAETVDVLAQQGQMPQQTAGNVKTILALLQRTGPDGKPVVEVPLKIANQTLAVGGFPVMRLPEVRLPISATQTPQ